MQEYKLVQTEKFASLSAFLEAPFMYEKAKEMLQELAARAIDPCVLRLFVRGLLDPWAWHEPYPALPFFCLLVPGSLL